MYATSGGDFPTSSVSPSPWYLPVLLLILCLSSSSVFSIKLGTPWGQKPHLTHIWVHSITQHRAWCYSKVTCHITVCECSEPRGNGRSLAREGKSTQPSPSGLTGLHLSSHPSVFLQNKARREDFCPRKLRQMHLMIDQLMAHSHLRYKGEGP